MTSHYYCVIALLSFFGPVSTSFAVLPIVPPRSSSLSSFSLSSFPVAPINKHSSSSLDFQFEKNSLLLLHAAHGRSGEAIFKNKVTKENNNNIDDARSIFQKANGEDKNDITSTENYVDNNEKRKQSWITTRAGMICAVFLLGLSGSGTQLKWMSRFTIILFTAWYYKATKPNKKQDDSNHDTELTTTTTTNGEINGETKQQPAKANHQSSSSSPLFGTSILQNFFTTKEVVPNSDTATESAKTSTTTTHPWVTSRFREAAEIQKQKEQAIQQALQERKRQEMEQAKQWALRTLQNAEKLAKDAEQSRQMRADERHKAQTWLSNAAQMSGAELGKQDEDDDNIIMNNHFQQQYGGSTKQKEQLLKNLDYLNDTKPPYDSDLSTRLWVDNAAKQSGAILGSNRKKETKQE